MGYYPTMDEIQRALESAPEVTPDFHGTYCFGEYCSTHVANYMSTTGEGPVCACQYSKVRYYIMRGHFGTATLYYNDEEFTKSVEYIVAPGSPEEIEEAKVAADAARHEYWALVAEVSREFPGRENATLRRSLTKAADYAWESAMGEIHRLSHDVFTDHDEAGFFELV